MPQMKNWRNSNFEADSETYMHDIETARESVFSLAKLSKTSCALLLSFKNANYLSEQIENLGK